MVDFVGYKTSTQSATVAATSADASATVLYTCPAKHSASVDMLFLSNNNAGAKKIAMVTEVTMADDITQRVKDLRKLF